MPDSMKLPIKRVHFGLAAPGAELTFRIIPARGFAATAVLDCDSKVVASWEWVELANGETITETLIPTGTYTLTVNIVFTEKTEVTAEVELAMNGDQKKRAVTGKKSDIGKVLAVVVIK